MRNPTAFLLLAAGVACLLAVRVGGESDVPKIDVYRMVQYDVGDQMFGSRRSGINHIGATASIKGSLSKHAVVVEFDSVTEETIEDLIVARNANTVIIILPEKMGDLSEKQRQQWLKVEKNLMNRAVPAAVYFAVDSKQASALRAKIEGNSGDVQLVVPGENAAPRLKNIKVANYHGMLSGGEDQGDENSDNAPIIAVVAYYDTFGIVPGLAMGADGNGSGMVALLELARLFSKLYKTSTRSKYSIIFVLTAGGRMNFAGTKSWLSHTDARMLDKVEFALCLDSIGFGKQLYLHTSKPLKDASLEKMFSTLSTAASAADVKLSHVHKKVNISDTAVAWEHEQFSRKRILAGTLSRHQSPDFEGRDSILDATVDVAALKRNTLLVANALARFMYGTSDAIDVFDGASKLQDTFFEAWAEGLAKEPRLVGFGSSKASSGGETPLVKQAEQILKNTCSSTAAQTFLIEGEKAFYKGHIKEVMSVYSTKPLSFDLAVSVFVLAYLLALLVLLQGTAEARKTLSEIVMGKKAPRYNKRA